MTASATLLERRSNAGPIRRPERGAEPLRVLHLLNSIRQSGNGIVNVAVDLACAQAASGLGVAVASSGGEYEPLLHSHGVECHTIPIKPARIIDPVLAMNRLHELIQYFRPHVLHAHTVAGALLGGALRVVRPRIKLVTHVHNEFERKASLMSIGDRVIAVSRAAAESLVRRGVPRGAIRAIHNGTVGGYRGACYSHQPPPHLKGRPIVTIAGMNRRKGIADLLHAFDLVLRACPDATLYLIGEGPDRSEFESLAGTLGAGAIHFEGFQANPRSWLRSAELFVLASHREPFGLVLTEAMEACCPIIATRVDGVPEVLGHGRAGLLVPSHAPHALARAILRLLENPADAARLRDAAARFVQCFSVAWMARRVETVYAELLPAYAAQVSRRRSIEGEQ